MSIQQRLEDLGITLPEPVAPVANYVPFTNDHGLVIVSGQLPMKDGALAYSGKLGKDVSVEDGTAAARQCAINLIAQANAACGGDLERVEAVLRLGGFVQSADDFFGQPQVINGASDLMVDVFGDKGKHARAAVGVNALPLNAAVEVEATFRIRA